MGKDGIWLGFDRLFPPSLSLPISLYSFLCDGRFTLGRLPEMRSRDPLQILVCICIADGTNNDGTVTPVSGAQHQQ